MNKVLICVNRRLTETTPSCAQRNSCQIAEELAKQIAAEQLAIDVERVFCLGRCLEGPTVKLVPSGEFLNGLDVAGMMRRIREFAARPAQQT